MHVRRAAMIVSGSSGVLFVMLCLSAVAQGGGTESWHVWFAEPQDPAPAVNRLVNAYPQFLVAGREPNAVAWRDGTIMPYDDGKDRKDFEAMLEAPTLKLQMTLAYPRGWPVAVPEPNFDPGRIRYEPLFRKMYGDSADEVRRHLKKVPWLPGGAKCTVLFTEVNGAAQALEDAGKQIDRLPDAVKSYVAKPVGGFLWRTIAGTNRLSMHSFGAALDFELPARLRRFWGWAPQPVAYPREVLADAALGQIVTAFEAHGFVWGGKWHHYDIIHFEYRPEFLRR